MDPDALKPFDAECGCTESETCGGDRCYVKAKLKWKWSAFKFRAKWSMIQNKKCQWVYRLKLTVKRAVRRLFNGLYRRSRVVIKKVCKLDAFGYKDPLNCFDPETLTVQLKDHEAHPLAESVAELNSLGAREGVYVVVGTGDYNEPWTQHSTDALLDDLQLGERDMGIMRDETNPDDPDQLLIVDPITFEGGTLLAPIAPTDPSTQEPTDPCLEGCPEDDNDSTWLIPAIAGGAGCCFLVAIIGFYVRRKRGPRVQFSEFASRMGVLDEEEPGMKHTVQHGEYSNLQSLDVHNTCDRDSGSNHSPRSGRGGRGLPSPRSEGEEMVGPSQAPLGKSILEHGVV